MTCLAVQGAEVRQRGTYGYLDELRRARGRSYAAAISGASASASEIWRACGLANVVVAHDTTAFELGGRAKREGSGHLIKPSAQGLCRSSRSTSRPPATDTTCFELSKDGKEWIKTPEMLCVGAGTKAVAIELRAGYRRPPRSRSCTST